MDEPQMMMIPMESYGYEPYNVTLWIGLAIIGSAGHVMLNLRPAWQIHPNFCCVELVLGRMLI